MTQSAQMGTGQLDDVAALVAEVREKIQRADEKLAALCKGTETFTMSIPARMDSDHDLVINDALIAAKTLADAIEAAPAPRVPADVAEVLAEIDSYMVASEGAVDELDRMTREMVKRLRDTLAMLQQTSGDLCPECGWRGVREDGCEFCQLATTRAELSEEQARHLSTIDERDTRDELLDAFVEALGGVEVHSEHSSANCPWRSALKRAEDMNAELARLGPVEEEKQSPTDPACWFPVTDLDTDEIRADMIRFGWKIRAIRRLLDPARGAEGMQK